MIEKPSMMDKAMQTKIGKPNLFVCAGCYKTWEEYRMAKDGVLCKNCKRDKERAENEDRYSELITNEADLHSVMKAMDRLNKSYMVTSTTQKGDLARGVPSRMWLVEELTKK